jgi:hypothetical protein
MTAALQNVVTQIHDRDAWNFFVFRKVRETLELQQLVQELQREIELLTTSSGSPLDSLVRAGEIESGLADLGFPSAGIAAELTDALARVADGGPVNRRALLDLLNSLPERATLRCSHPEGFSYYGLNPLDFADLARRIQCELPPNVAVIGIRTVGTTLGAVVAAALRSERRRVDRISVRPEGEPYHRRTKLDVTQMAWVREQLQRDADFLVVDEGPGFSGSTFISVARALEGSGASRDRITLLCSRPFHPQAGNISQAEEWTRYRSHVIDYGRRLPPEAGLHLANGKWRQILYSSPDSWPACWTELERIKHLSRDGSSLFKFEGFGRFGAGVKGRAAILSAGGFAPKLRAFTDGYAEYHFVKGRPLTANSTNQEILSRMAQYCAFRVAQFPAPQPDTLPLLNMMGTNIGLEFSRPSPVSELPVERPVYPDCQMQPHEWLITRSSQFVKTDATDHAEGHQLPGPVDTAWDIAGIIIEWDLPYSVAEGFVREYQHRSGDPVHKRLSPYLLAYSILRMAYFRMAAASMSCCAEADTLQRQYRLYASKAEALLQEPRLFASK